VYGVVGDRFDMMPIPLVDAATTYFPAGVLVIGVEGRQIDPDTVAAELGHLTPAQEAAVKAQQPADLDDSGPSVHVIDAATGTEHLRFDCFDNGPHYHYVIPDEGYQIVVTMDRAACGDPIDFAVGCLQTRLRPMLAAAGRDDLAQLVDDDLIAEVIPAVHELARQLAAV
jgi:hypothetical protein